MLDLLILDLDGTLLRFPLNWAEVEKRIESIIGCKAKFLEFISKYYATPAFWEVNSYLEELESSVCREAWIYDDTLEFLSKAKSLTKRLAIVTMQGVKACMCALELLGLNDALCIPRESAHNRIEQIAMTLKLSKADRDKTVFIGDKILDGVAAFINGIKGIVVLRDLKSSRITETDDIVEDLKCLGIEIVHDLKQAMEALARIP